MEDLRVFVEAGKAPAIFDAWTLVIDFNVAIPNWLPPATQNYIEGTLKYISKKYRSKMLHYYRLRTVLRLIDDGIKWDNVFEAAENELGGTQYAGAATTIESSYRIASKDLASEEKALDYYTAMKDTRPLVGTQFARRTKKDNR